MKKFNMKEYFSFSKKERNAAIAILAVTGCITLAGIFFQSKDEDNFVTNQFGNELDSAASTLAEEKNSFKNVAFISKNDTSIHNKNLFYFDPNTLDENGWKKLGLPDKTVHTIINYRNKGGKFYKPEDIRKIYGLSDESAEKLMPYVQIKSNVHPPSGNNQYAFENGKKDIYPKKKYSVIDINQATADDWKSLPGIGDVLSKRIVKFRNSMHGFTSVDDVAKTYGLSDSVFNNIKPYLKLSSPNNTHN